MNKLSIKLRVTLWYTSFMVVLVALTLVFLLSVSNNLSRLAVKDRLISDVEKSFEEIEFDDGELEIDDELDFFDNGVYLSVYGSDGQLLYGGMPSEFDAAIAFSSQELQQAESHGQQWYVYDYRISLEGYGDVWVRGIASQSGTGSTIQTMILLALIALPFVVVIAAVGGYLITKQAFRPITKISEAAEKIGVGNDLTKRIHLGNGKDEIYMLANTFDRMFDRLQRSFETEKQFTSDASHELRTPTSVIIAQCEYAINNADTLEEAKESLTVILGQSEKMSRLISQLLMLARTDKGSQKLELELINLSEISEIIVEEQKIIAEEKNISIQTQIEPDIILRADQTMMMRVFINLISNAVKYGKSGGNVLVRLSKDGDFVTGAVQDNGIGIAEEHMAKIWDRFFQADPARSADEEEGMGLGLSMVKWIIEAHRGTIRAESILGEGSTFVFKIPYL